MTEITYIDMSGEMSLGRADPMTGVVTKPYARKPFESETEKWWREGVKAATDGQLVSWRRAAASAAMEVAKHGATDYAPPANEEKACRECDPSVGVVCDKHATPQQPPRAQEQEALKDGMIAEFSDDGQDWTVGLLYGGIRGPGHAQAGQYFSKGSLISWKMIRREARPIASPTTPDEGRWIEWKGGDCPVLPGTKIEIRQRNGMCFTREARVFYPARWLHKETITILNEDHIIAYRIVPPEGV